MKKLSRIFSLFLALVLFVLMAASSPAYAANEVEYEFAFAVHSISENKYLRHVGPDASVDTLHDDEYYVIYMTIHNHTGKDMNISKLELFVDAMSWTWKDITVKTSYSVSIGKGYVNRISPGKHTCTVKVDGKAVHSNTFMMPRDWGSLMKLPTEEQLKSYNGSKRSAYISFYPEFSRRGYTEYAIDFRSDHQPVGTYYSPISWWMNLDNLRKQYVDVWADYGSLGGAYCGLQVWEDGTRAVIMSVWDIFCRDKSGNVTRIMPEVVYPEYLPRNTHEKSGEGSFAQGIYPYDWKAGKDYRFLLQTFEGDNGNIFLALWIQDLDTGVWTKLFVFDYGTPDTWIDSTAGFLENYVISAGGDVRTLEFWNVRAKMKNSGKWENAETVHVFLNGSAGNLELQGSYNFGQDDYSCWIITSGIPNLCVPNSESAYYKVPYTEKGRPYD